MSRKRSTPDRVCCHVKSSGHLLIVEKKVIRFVSITECKTSAYVIKFKSGVVHVSFFFQGLRYMLVEASWDM